jgi:hypothetical protein
MPIFAGELLDSGARKKLHKEGFDFKTHYKIETLLEEIFKVLEPHLKKDFAIQLIGYSLGNLYIIICVFTHIHSRFVQILFQNWIDLFFIDHQVRLWVFIWR